MNFEVFEEMYQRLWKLIYDILAVLGYEVKDGDLVKVEKEAE